MIFTLLSILGSLFSQASLGGAGANASSITQDILACEAKRLKSPGACYSEDEARQRLAQVCADPVGYVCKGAPPRGRMLSSRCKINFNENSDAAQTPEVIALNAKIKAASNALITRHLKECQVKNTQCMVKLKVKYAADLRKIQIDTAYTPARMDRVTKMFAEVKSTAIEVLQKSTHLSAADKAKLIKRIQNTKFLDPRKETPRPCYYLGSDGADTGIYNSPSQVEDGTSSVNFCMGAMAMLDREEESSVIWTLGHELTHSIDPCTLDRVSVNSVNFPGGDHFYQSISKCLRGGGGPRGCDGGALHCNDASNTVAYCVLESGGASSGAIFQDCMKDAKKMQNCPLSASGGPAMNLAEYRHGPGAVDQTQESFSDFFGAEIYGKILKRKNASLAHPTQEKLDLLTGLGADFASLHGTCLDQNTNDPHPPGRMRLKNNMMSNPDFAQAICGRNSRKSCEGL